MLAYLAVRREARRDELIALLWGDVPEAKARNAFRQALHRLRTGLGDGAIPQDRDRVALAPDSQVAVDRTEFLAAHEAGRLDDAIALYRGDFLDGLVLGEPAFETWLDGERTRLRTVFQEALHMAARAALDAGRFPDAARLAARLGAAAPYDEDAALLEATILAGAGRNNEALAVLDRFTARLRRDLDIAAPERAKEMAARLQRGGARPQATTPRGTAAAAPLAFVGRDDELARLLGMLADLRQERGATVVVTGEAGVGRTRLLGEFIARARSLGRLLVLRGQERAGGSAVPYASLAEALRPIVRASGISGASQHLLAEAARILPELRDTFQLPEAGPVQDEAARLRFFEGVAALIDAAAYELPVCIVLDDVQHASSSTLDLLGYLAGRLQGSPVLILLTLRDGAASPLAGRPLAQNGTHIALAGLREPDAIRLAEAALERTGAAAGSPQSAQRIAADASGNPARILEGARRVAAGEPPASAPAAIRDILASRFRACPPSQRRVLFAAALLQRAAPLRLLAAASHLSESATYDAAIALEQGGLLVQRDDGYAVAHDLSSSFVAEIGGAAGRALLAGWAADALALEPGATAAELAQLYALAGQQAPAFAHARRAAFDAAASAAMQEAMRLLGIAHTYAPSAAARAEVEALLNAFGGGTRALLGSGLAEALHDFATEPPAPAQRAGEGAAPTPAAAREPAAPPRKRGVLGIRPLVWYSSALTLAVAALIARETRRDTTPVARTLTDSLLVAERGRERAPRVDLVTGRLDAGTALSRSAARRSAGPTWVDSLALPWINPVPSPTGAHVAVERMTAAGTDVYVMGAGRRDTIPLALGGRDDIVLGWAPDGQSLLVMRARSLPDGAYAAGLFAYHLLDAGRPVAIDTLPQHAVTEAAWSPDGTRIAWVARVSPERRRRVLVATADGSHRRAVGAPSTGEDYRVTWSPDGALLAFTSDRDGNAELYAYDVDDARLWRLTNDAAHDDRATFSPDGRFVAFESTRAGDPGVYVMPALGGSPVRVTPPERAFSLAGWRGAAPVFVDRLRIIGGESVPPRDTLALWLLATDPAGNPLPVSPVTWTLLDTGVVRFAPGQAATGLTRRIVAAREGSARLVAAIPGWRADTLMLRTGVTSAAVLDDDFSRGLDASRWLALGDPSPAVRPAPDGRGSALYPSADLQWLSGILSRASFALRPGSSIATSIYAPFSGAAVGSGSIAVALVAAGALPDPVAPQIFPVLSIEWNAESGRLVYVAGRESHSEVADASSGTGRAVRISIDASGRAVFDIGGSTRWRSSARVVSPQDEIVVQAWLGGRATGVWGAFGRVVIAGH